MKINNIPKTFKFLFVFFFIVILPLFIYFMVQETQTSIRLKTFSPEQIDLKCPDSPSKRSFSKCYLEDLSYLFVEATLFDTYKIIKASKSVLEIDQKKSRLEKRAFIDFFRGQEIIIDHLNSFMIQRNSANFSQIMYFPILKYMIKNHFEKIKIEISHIKSKHDLSNEEKERIKKSELKINKIVKDKR